MNVTKRKSGEQAEAQKESVFLPLPVESTTDILSRLPVEITTDILSRLPVDSLVLQCKLVCKTWQSLIEDPAFVDVHTSRLIRLLDDASPSSDIDNEGSMTTDFFLSSYERSGTPNKDEIVPMLRIGKYINAEKGFKVSKPVHIENHGKYVNKLIVGSSNGLVCLYDDRDISVYNPCTNELANLPRPRFKNVTEQQYNISSKVRGFGYSPCTNEYKVILICYKRFDEGKDCIGEVGVYTLGTGKWRMISEEMPTEFCASGILMNKAVHWLKLRSPWNADDIRYEIVSFDLEYEEFRRNIVPPPLQTRMSQLGLFGGCLCIFAPNEASQTLDVWVMNYKEKSWTMKFKIPAKRKREMSNVPIYFGPISYFGKSKILVRSWAVHTLTTFDTETGNIGEDISVNAHFHFRRIIPYMVKSLVSLKALGEEDVKCCTYEY